jgi:DNA primase
VASAGTSLTEEQARLIRRFTKNVTVLYDGDAAGIRASMRGIDILLQQGLDVRVLLLPDGEDPDSLAKNNPNELERCLAEEVKDFISFKTEILLADAGQDPLRKAEVLKELARTIALIDDPMRRSVLHMETSKQMGADERIFLSEINKNRLEKAVPNREEREMIPTPTEAFVPAPTPINGVGDQKFPHELYLLRLLVHFPDTLIEEYTLAQKAVMEMEGYEFEDQQAAALFTHIASEVLAERPVTQESLVQLADPELSRLVVELLTQEWTISENWTKSFEIEIDTPEQNVAKDFEAVMDRIKLKTILGWIKEIDEEIKSMDSYQAFELEEKLIAKKMFMVQIQEITKKYGTSIYR